MLLHDLHISRCDLRVNEEPEKAWGFGMKSTLPWRKFRPVEEEQARREDEETGSDVVFEEDMNEQTSDTSLDSPLENFPMYQYDDVINGLERLGKLSSKVHNYHPEIAAERPWSLPIYLDPLMGFAAYRECSRHGLGLYQLLPCL